MGKTKLKKILSLFGITILVGLALVGWAVLFTQNPDILAKARLRFIQAVNSHTNLSNGPCLGKIDTDWVLDIAHIPRESVDDLPQNQCTEYRSGKVHHFVEMSPKGEIIVVR